MWFFTASSFGLAASFSSGNEGDIHAKAILFLDVEIRHCIDVLRIQLGAIDGPGA
jgi:hypothetical protein